MRAKEKKRQNKIRIKQNKIHMMVETLENKEKNKTLVVIKNCIYKWKIQVEFFLHETEKDTTITSIIEFEKEI